MPLCMKCQGTGVQPCHRCHGTGRDDADITGVAAPAPASAPAPAVASTGNAAEPARCPSCHGVGTETCRLCDGAGEV